MSGERGPAEAAAPDGPAVVPAPGAVATAGVVDRAAAVSRTGWLRRWWPVWAVLVLLGFAIPQTVALVAGEPGDGFVAGTFSETLGGWLGTSGGTVTVGWIVFSVAVLGGAVWWVVHARAGGWPWERDHEEADE